MDVCSIQNQLVASCTLPPRTHLEGMCSSHPFDATATLSLLRVPLPSSRWSFLPPGQMFPHSLAQVSKTRIIFSDFGSSFLRFSSGTRTNAMLPKTFKCKRFVFVPKYSVVDTLSLAPIDEIHSRNCCLCPIDLGHVLLMQHGTGHLKNCAILPLSNTVLLWCVPAREFSTNSLLF